jgi:riboflavin synthase
VFTGLIKGLGRVIEQKCTARSGYLKIETDLAAGVQLGDSMAVNGVCLTIARLGGNWLSADVMTVTMQATNLALLRYGDPVNLEPALAIGERLGGHLVSGHVDGLGKIRAIRADSKAVLIRIAVPASIGSLLTRKGSVAVNGVSLTIQQLEPEWFEISLIPHTLRETTFVQAKIGDLVNLETDRAARLLERDTIEPLKESITAEFLAEHGYV